MKKFFLNLWNETRDLFGLRKNSKYVKGYLNDANMRSGLFMAGIIVALEIWLVIRQTGKYIIPALAEGSPLFQTIFQNLWTYFLLMSLGIAMVVYCSQYLRSKNAKSKMIVSVVFAGISIALCCFFPFSEHHKM